MFRGDGVLFLALKRFDFTVVSVAVSLSVDKIAFRRRNLYLKIRGAHLQKVNKIGPIIHRLLGAKSDQTQGPTKIESLSQRHRKEIRLLFIIGYVSIFASAYGDVKDDVITVGISCENC